MINLISLMKIYISIRIETHTLPRPLSPPLPSLPLSLSLSLSRSLPPRPYLFIGMLYAFFPGIGVVGFNRRLGFLSQDSQSQTAGKTLLECFQVNRRCTGAAMMGREFKYLFYRDAFYNQFQRATDYIIRYV